jgi:Fe-S-cluster containining protein
MAGDHLKEATRMIEDQTIALLNRPLPVIESCDGCGGSCCRVVTLPPFRRVFAEAGEEAWERLRWDRPELREGLLAAERAIKASGSPTFGSPCLWLDGETGRCRHHEFRPRACREFAVGGVDCRDARRRNGVG